MVTDVNNVPFKVLYDEAAVKDMLKLDKALRLRVHKKILEVAQNPLPITEGGRGFPLGNKMGLNLSEFFKIKLQGIGIRAVYELKRIDNEMVIIVVGVRDEEAVYREAVKRIAKK